MQQKLIFESLEKKEQIKRQLLLNKGLLVPAIFGGKEFEVIIKLLDSARLNPTERSYLSRSIRKKLAASCILSGLGILEEISMPGNIMVLEQKSSYYLNGMSASPLSKNELNKRIKQAEKIISQAEKDYPGKAIFVVGSFLYKKEYNDIDVIILGDADHEQQKGNVHYILLPENEIGSSLFFHSSMKISIGNSLCNILFEVKKDYKALYFIYQEIIIGILENNLVEKELRDFFALSSLIIDDKVINSIELDSMIGNYRREKDKVKLISAIIKEAFLRSIKDKNFITFAGSMMKTNSSLIKEYPKNEHLIIFNKLLREVLNES